MVKLNFIERLVIRSAGIFMFPELYARNRKKGKSRKESFDRARYGYG